jgi:hypothetical protein
MLGWEGLRRAAPRSVTLEVADWALLLASNPLIPGYQVVPLIPRYHVVPARACVASTDAARARTSLPARLRHPGCPRPGAIAGGVETPQQPPLVKALASAR